MREIEGREDSIQCNVPKEKGKTYNKLVASQDEETIRNSSGVEDSKCCRILQRKAGKAKQRAQHCTALRLLQKGYRVRGTVRKLASAEYVQKEFAPYGVMFAVAEVPDIPMARSSNQT